MAKTIGEALAPAILRRLERMEQTQTAQHVETIQEWTGIYPHSDRGIVDFVIHALGVEGAFTPAALALMADEYQAMERRHEATRARNAAARYLENA